MFIALLGRQPELSIAELKAVFGDENVKSSSSVAAVVQTDHMEINDLGGTIKCGKIIHQITDKNHAIQSISSWILRHYSAALSQYDGKITLGISAYSLPITASQVQKNWNYPQIISKKTRDKFTPYSEPRTKPIDRQFAQ